MPTGMSQLFRWNILNQVKPLAEPEGMGWGGEGGLGPTLSSQGCELGLTLNERCKQRGRKHNENEATPQTKKTYAVK